MSDNDWQAAFQLSWIVSGLAEEDVRYETRSTRGHGRHDFGYVHPITQTHTHTHTQ